MFFAKKNSTSVFSSFIKNTSYIAISKVLENIFSYLLIIVLSRVLGAEGLGIYSFVFAFAGMFFIFSDFGLSSLLIVEYNSIDKAKFFIEKTLKFRFLLFLCYFFLLLIFSFFSFNHLTFLFLFLTGIIYFISNFMLIYYNVLTIKQKGKQIALANLIERFSSFVLGVLVLFLFKKFLFLLVALLISRLFKLVYILHNSRDVFSVKNFHLDINWIKSTLKRSFPFLLVGIFSLIYNRLDLVMLGFMKSNLVVGWYSSGYKLIDIFNLIPVTLLTLGFPLFSKLGFKKRKKLFLNLLIFLISISIFANIFIWLFGGYLLQFIYGFSNFESISSLRILMLGEPFMFASILIGYFLSAIKKQSVFAKISGFGALINIILNFILIPKLSLYGAAVSTDISFFLMSLFMGVVIVNYFSKNS